MNEAPVAVPTNKQFLFALKAFSEPLPIREWLGHPEVIKALNGKDVQARQALELLCEKHRRLMENAYSMPCAQWFQNQKMFMDAKGIVFKQSQITDVSALMQLFPKAFEIIRESGRVNRATAGLFDGYEPNGKTVAARLQVVFDQCMVSVETKWFVLLLGAFYEYFHLAETVDDYLKHQKKVERLAATIKAGLRAQEKLFSFPIYGEGLWFQKAVQNAEEASTALMAQIDTRREMRRAMQGTLPIYRNDATSNERLLIFWLWLAHKLIFDKPNSPVVQLLMQLDGVSGVANDTMVKKTMQGFKADLVDRNRATYSNLMEYTRRSIIGR